MSHSSILLLCTVMLNEEGMQVFVVSALCAFGCSLCPCADMAHLQIMSIFVVHIV